MKRRINDWQYIDNFISFNKKPHFIHELKIYGDLRIETWQLYLFGKGFVIQHGFTVN